MTAAQREARAAQGSNLGQGPCGCSRQLEKGELTEQQDGVHVFNLILEDVHLVTKNCQRQLKLEVSLQLKRLQIPA